MINVTVGLKEDIMRDDGWKLFILNRTMNLIQAGGRTIDLLIKTPTSNSGWRTSNENENME